MTFAPPSLLEVRRYLKPVTGLPDVQLGIVGGPSHIETGTSYHLGEDQLKMWLNPYSVRTARDKAGLSDAASAFDIGWFRRLVELTAHLVAEARAGRTPDRREIIGPGADGRAYRWDHLSGWVPQIRPRGDSHETHTHLSDYRDSEHRDKTGVFKRFFEGDDDMTPEQAKQLDALHGMIYWNVRPWLESFIHATDATLAAIAAKVDLDPAELDAIKAAAAAGAQTGVIAGADDLAAAIVAALPEQDLTKTDVEAAVRTVLRSVPAQ